ncbi:DUF1330 domain-containing protein [Pseudomonas sp. TNT2022 ID1044]|uniref:DUF1330 domain-containing protein n=1 Tax=Pseudomonas sp. TNT2022 ID1044 TaxID=2942636 RepID=UPI0023621FDF|nr:DUF1330 domain-containing protein [Pseudomonas sp. TNT2022 ID1044]MDD0999736.1 DUF1330 domain-containing protein [Pseudomonas sp. TNT2022 ID1044]
MNKRNFSIDSAYGCNSFFFIKYFNIFSAQKPICPRIKIFLFIKPIQESFMSKHERQKSLTLQIKWLRALAIASACVAATVSIQASAQDAHEQAAPKSSSQVEAPKTYLINHLRIPGGVPNSQSLDYLEKVEATVAPFGGKWLAQGPVEVVEGSWPGYVVLMEFPNHKAATDWYKSTKYQSILPLRTNNSISDIIFVDHLPEGFTVKGFAEGVRSKVAGK